MNSRTSGFPGALSRGIARKALRAFPWCSQRFSATPQSPCRAGGIHLHLSALESHEALFCFRNTYGPNCLEVDEETHLSCDRKGFSHSGFWSDAIRTKNYTDRLKYWGFFSRTQTWEPKCGSLKSAGSSRKAPLSCNAALSMLQCSFSFVAAQLLVKMTPALQKSE